MAPASPTTRASLAERYSEERVSRWIEGELTLAELDGLSDADLRRIALIGHRLLGSGQLADAGVLFKGLVALSPKVGAFHAALGAVDAASGRLDEAATRLDRAVELDPRDAEALVQRGELQVRLRNTMAAAADLSAALALDDGAGHPWVQRARALLASLPT